MAAGRFDISGMTATRVLGVLVIAGTLTACATAPSPSPMANGHAGGTMAPYQVNGVWYRPHEQPRYDEIGVATWYGPQYHARHTADGEIFDMDRPSGAHTTLPLPCIVEVTNLDNGRRIRLRINDRGPFVQGRILDVSREAARELGFYQNGSGRVRVRYVGPAAVFGGGQVETAVAAPSPRAPSPRAPSPRAMAPPWSAPPDAGDSPPPRAAGPVVQVQAAAFSDHGNAERAAALFSGAAQIVPFDRDGGRLWRVVVEGQAGESPSALKFRVAAAGFPQARIVDEVRQREPVTTAHDARQSAALLSATPY